jgi:hypothetical protein
MRDDIKLFVYHCNDMGKEPGLIIRVRSMDGMNEEVTVSEWDMMRCRDTEAKGKLIGDAIRDLAAMTILPAEDLLRMSAEGENALAVRNFVFPRVQSPAFEPEPEPEPEPKPEPGWGGFLSGVTDAILKAHKNYVFPKARVVKGGKHGR